MPEGKYFYIKSKLSGLVLDVNNYGKSPGTPVALWAQKPEGENNDNQMWYEDRGTWTIRTMLNDFCLELDDRRRSTLIISPYEEKNKKQNWVIIGERIVYRWDATQVFDVKEWCEDAEAEVCSFEYHWGRNQKWEKDKTEAKYFYIESKMCGKVLDIESASSDPDATIVIWEKHEEDNQLWYEDKHGQIRSKLNDFVFDSAANKGTMVMEPFEHGNKDQMWTVRDDVVVNMCTGEVLDIKDNCGDDGTEICSWEFHGGDNQRWRVLYVD